MTRDIGNLVGETLQRRNTQPWIWLYEITLELNTVATSVVRLTSHTVPITFATKTYSPYWIGHDVIRADSKGNQPFLNLAFANVGREFARVVDTAKGGNGNPVTITLVHQAHLADSNAKWDATFEIRQALVEDKQIVLRLELPSFARVPIPKDQFIRDRCRWRYKSAECGYIGSGTECTKRLVGPNGCEFWGADERANNRPILHPINFGGFPSLPRIVA